MAYKKVLNMKIEASNSSTSINIIVIEADLVYWNKENQFGLWIFSNLISR